MPQPGREAGVEKDDWAERWGKRIGAVLGPALLSLAVLWLLWHLSGGAQAA